MSVKILCATALRWTQPRVVCSLIATRVRSNAQYTVVLSGVDTNVDVKVGTPIAMSGAKHAATGGSRNLAVLPPIGNVSPLTVGASRSGPNSGSECEGKSSDTLQSLGSLADNWLEGSGSGHAPPALEPAMALEPATALEPSPPAKAPHAATLSRRHVAVATPQLEQAQSFIVQRFQREASVRIQHNRMGDAFVALHWSHFFRTLFVQLFLPVCSVYWAIRGRTAVLRFVLWCRQLPGVWLVCTHPSARGTGM